MQRDLAVSVIDRCLVERQQTQLQEFLENQTECIIVTKINELGKLELVMHNKKAESIYQSMDSPFIELTSDNKNDQPDADKKLLSLAELLSNYQDDQIQDLMAKVTLDGN